MRIALIIRRLNIKGGTQRQAVELALSLASLGHKVTFYTFHHDPENCYAELKNFSVITQERSRSKFVVPGLNYFVQLYRENNYARKLAYKIDPDTEILNPHDQVSYRVAYFFKRDICKIPSVWMMNDLPTKYFSYLREKENNPEFKVSLLKRALYYLVDWYDFKKYVSSQDIITVLDNRDKVWVKEFFYKDAQVVRSGADLSRFLFRNREKPGNPIQLLTVGIFLPHRRFEDIVLAMRLLKERGINTFLTIVGDTSVSPAYYEKLQKIINAHGLETNILCRGKVKDDELQEIYAKSDIFLFPCHLQSWGLAVFEAMAAGLPVIVSNTAGASEILTTRENALVVPPKAPEALSEAIYSLYADSELYSQLSKNGRRFVENNLSWEKYTTQMVQLFETLKR